MTWMVDMLDMLEVVDLLQKSHLGPLHHPGPHCFGCLPNNAHLRKKLPTLLFQQLHSYNILMFSSLICESVICESVILKLN